MLDNFNNLIKNVEEKRKEEEQKGNPIFTNICHQPFWRPKDKERLCSSGAKLGGYTANTIDDLEKRLKLLKIEEEEIVFTNGIMTEEEKERRTEIWEEEQKILKKIREIKLKERSKHTLPK